MSRLLSSWANERHVQCKIPEDIRKINNRALSQGVHIISPTKITCSTKHIYNLTYVYPLFPIKCKNREVSARPESPMGAAILSRHKTHMGCAARSARQLLRVSVTRLTLSPCHFNARLSRCVRLSQRADRNTAQPIRMRLSEMVSGYVSFW